VDVQTCKLIVLDREVGSMTEFKQIVGRGTRLHADTDKYYFTLVDFRQATKHFADPDFDGEPVQIYEPGEDDPPVPPETGDPPQAEENDGQEDQNPEDEPAEELLSAVLKTPLQKNRKPIPKAFDDKSKSLVKLPLPDSWTWATVEAIVPPDETVTYGILKPVWVADGVPTVRVTEMKTGSIETSKLPCCDPIRAEKFRKTTLKEWDLLVSKDGTIGKTAFVPAGLAGGNITQHVIRLPISSQLCRPYIRIAIDSPYCQSYMKGETKGVALQGVNVGDFRKMPIPLPPLAEQHRFVARVEQLMALCDQLEQQLSQAEQSRRGLLEAVLRESLAGRLPEKSERSHAAL
jgi:hypothetical protein